MPRYMTRQRKLLMEYLAEHPDERLSAGRIAEALAEENISVSAVYRNLAELEQDGQLKRAAQAGSSELFYRYAAAERCRGFLHLCCTCCGKTYHMDQKRADILAQAIAEDEGFALDRAETVLYGVCGACRS